MDVDRFRWTISDRARQLLGELEIIKRVLEALPYIPEVEVRLTRESLLKSAVFSARVEGITTDLKINANRETQNLLRAYRLVNQTKTTRLTDKFVLELHQLVMQGQSFQAGKWRSEPWAIYNQAGIAIYLAPLHTEIPKLMEEWVEKIVSLSESPPITAAIAQFILEKIHPFADGNGRVGRLVSTYLMNMGGWKMRGLVPVEEYVEDHREQYYSALEPSSDISEMIEFWIEALVAQGNKTIDEYGKPLVPSPTGSLMPRRKEIYQTIYDHPQCSFDFIRRRFMTVNIKTLQYDLAQLTKQGLVTKLGITRGAVYEVAK
jgi:Fic family protein